MTNPYRSALESILPYAKLYLEYDGDMEPRDKIALEHDIDNAGALLRKPEPPASAVALSAFGVGLNAGRAEGYARVLELTEHPTAREVIKSNARAALSHIDEHMLALPGADQNALTPHVARMRGKVAESFARARAGVHL